MPEPVFPVVLQRPPRHRLQVPALHARLRALPRRGGGLHRRGPVPSHACQLFVQNATHGLNSWPCASAPARTTLVITTMMEHSLEPAAAAQARLTHSLLARRINCAHCFVSATKADQAMPYGNIRGTLIPRQWACKVRRVTPTDGEPTNHPEFTESISQSPTASGCISK